MREFIIIFKSMCFLDKGGFKRKCKELRDVEYQMELIPEWFTNMISGKTHIQCSYTNRLLQGIQKLK